MDPTRFELRAVAHLVQPWGRPARDLDALREGVASAPPGVLFHHTVQFQLRHAGAEELPPDDLSAWIGGVVQDAETAERLAFAVQSQNTSAESVRAAILEVLDRITPEGRRRRDAPEDGDFVFLSTTSVDFPTGVAVQDGPELVDALMAADAGVWFFHLVEEPWFRDGRMPLRDWLGSTGDRRLGPLLEAAAGVGLPIEKSRAQLLRRWRRGRIARRVSEGAATPEDERREAGRRAMARFVRRVTRTGESS